MKQGELIPHLFRTEFRKITSSLVRQFGVAHMAVAEDIASDTFLQAMESWTYNGLPESPVAWLYAVARNKARNKLMRDAVFRGKVTPYLRYHQSNEPDISLTEEGMTDSQLSMLFAVCHPSVPVESQIGLALRVLCGLGIDEIAAAFLTNRETINKRLYRARERLRSENVSLSLPTGRDLGGRLEAVMRILYLLFNEGYYSECHDSVLREDLCKEAILLTRMLLDNEATDTPPVRALLALMCFHASRFSARRGTSGELIPYENQDERLWDQSLIAEGVQRLHSAAVGNALSRYHVEAGIAYWLTVREDSEEKWKSALKLYDLLLQIAYSPVAALNRAYVLSKVEGREAGILAARQLNLVGNPFYHALLGELHTGWDNSAAHRCYTEALATVRTAADRQLIADRLKGLIEMASGQ